MVPAASLHSTQNGYFHLSERRLSGGEQNRSGPRPSIVKRMTTDKLLQSTPYPVSADGCAIAGVIRKFKK